MSHGPFKDKTYNVSAYKIFFICMYEKDMALNNPLGLICHKTHKKAND